MSVISFFVLLMIFVNVKSLELEEIQIKPITHNDFEFEISNDKTLNSIMNHLTKNMKDINRVFLRNIAEEILNIIEKKERIYHKKIEFTTIPEFGTLKIYQIDLFINKYSVKINNKNMELVQKLPKLYKDIKHCIRWIQKKLNKCETINIVRDLTLDEINMINQRLFDESYRVQYLLVD